MSNIKYVVVIEMENRSLDNLLSGYYTQPFNSNETWGQAIDIVNPKQSLPPPNNSYKLSQLSLESSPDPYHTHSAFATDWANGADDGWIGEGGTGSGWANSDVFSYVPTSETAPYAQLIENYGFSDHTFQANEGESFPAHQYLISGQSGGHDGTPLAYLAISENPPYNSGQATYPFEGQNEPNFCDTSNDLTTTIDMAESYAQEEGSNDGNNPAIEPCYNNSYTTIFDELAPIVTPPQFAWEYIANSATSLWAAPMAVNRYANYNGIDNPIPNFEVDPDAYKFVTQEIPSGSLPAVTYLTPCVRESDHPGSLSNDGPQWVGWVINSIGQNTALWNQTAIFVVWDDWGGWYDHEPAIQGVNGNPYGNPSDPYEWGYRVPLIAVSPYTVPGTVDKVVRSHSSILDFIEYNFGTGNLGTDDTTGSNTDHLTGLFNSATALPFTPIKNITFPSSTQRRELAGGSCPGA